MGGHPAVWRHGIHPGGQCDVGATHGYLKVTIKDANNASIGRSMMMIRPGRDKVYSCSYVIENGTQKMAQCFMWDAAAKAAKVVEQSDITSATSTFDTSDISEQSSRV